MNYLPKKIVAIVCAVSIVVSGCSANLTDFKGNVARQAETMREGPSSKPRPSDTSFTESLRCMDRLFITYGVQDASMMIEDLSDQTKKMQAGTKDMFISAVSQMTRRSRAIRLVAYGSATDTTLNAFLASHASNGALSATFPLYSIRGSVSQFDDAIVKEQGDAGVSLGGLSTSAAKQATASVLGLDLNVIRTDDLSLIPGVTARNSVQIFREGVGADGELVVKKFGANFNFTLAKSEGQAQALRTLVELSAIEILGKLSKVPYWSCLGTAANDPSVDLEIVDWWESFAADPQSLVVYFQNQMHVRGLYRGDVDGRVNQEFLSAIKAYQQALGLPGDANLDLDFLKKYFAANHGSLEKSAQNLLVGVSTAPARSVRADSSFSATPEAGAIRVTVVDSKRAGRSYQKGELYSIETQLNQDAFMYCYLIDENHKINQFFPNSVMASAATKGGVRVRFPGTLPFRFVANSKGITETIACLASIKDLGTDGIGNLTSIRDLNGLKESFRKMAGASVAIGAIDVRPN